MARSSTPIFINNKHSPVTKGIMSELVTDILSKKPGPIQTLRSLTFMRKMLQYGIPLKTAIKLIVTIKLLPKAQRKLVLLMLFETIGANPFVRGRALKLVKKLKG